MNNAAQPAIKPSVGFLANATRLATAQQAAWLLSWLLVLCQLAGQAATPAASATLRGTVQTADGQPAEYVSVALQGTTLGTLTDAQGHFRLRAALGNYVVVAQLVGYAPQTQAVRLVAGGVLEVQFRLTASAAELAEVVVRGGQLGRSYTEPVSEVATRTPTPLRDVPQAVQVLPRQVLADRGVQSIGEATKLMAGVNAFSSTQYNDYVLRGFRSSAGNFAYNGIRGDLFQFGQAVQTYNLERVEVLKGPASVLFSAGNPGGVINYVTKKAQAAPRYEAELTVGSFRQYRGLLDATGAVTQDKRLLYRAIVGYENTGQLDRNQHIQSLFLAPQLQFNYSRSGSLAYELNASIDRRTEMYQRGVPALYLGNEQWQLDRYPRDFSLIDPHGYSRSANYAHQLRLTQGLGSKLKLSVLGLAVHNHTEQFDLSPGDFDTGAVRDSLTMSQRLYNSDNTSYQVSALLNYDLTTGPVRHQLVLGGDFNDSHAFYRYSRFNDHRVSLFNLDYSWARYDQSPAALAAIEAAGADVSDDDEYTRFAAGYVQDQLSLGAHWKALLGGRLEHHRYRNQYRDAVSSQVTSADTLRSTAFSPRAGLVYQPVPTVSLYASYTQGFQPQYASYAGSGGPFGPERSRQYEVGAKAEWLGGRLLGLASAYYIQKYDVLAPDPTDPSGNRLLTVGDVHSRGVELSLQGSLTQQLSVVANYALNDTYTPGDSGFDGYGAGEFPNAPHHNANLWATYTLARGPLRGLRLGAGGNYLSQRATYTPGFGLPAYLTLDASLGYQRQGWRANLSLNNLTNTRYYYGAYGPANLWPGNPFSFRLTLGYVLGQRG